MRSSGERRESSFMILVPVKNFANAKQRLSPILPQSARTVLAQAMLRDVLDALSEFGGDNVSLVTSDPFAKELVANYGFELIPDDSNVSETDAIVMATQVCEDRGIQSTLVIPGDIPLISATEIEAIYTNAPQTGSVLVPAHDRRGTNAILRRPAALFPLRFGNDSFLPHLATAKSTGHACVVLSLGGIGLDIDSPEDLSQLALAPGTKRSQLLARSFCPLKMDAGSVRDVENAAVTAKS
jgi:2-phospho-L-lactate/phosphoenolpyruvate guanylyltransferase